MVPTGADDATGDYRPGMSDSIHIEPITADNVAAACGLSVTAEQRGHVAPVANSLAEAYANYDTAWPRLVYHGEHPVAFVMGAFDPDCPIDFFRCGIWRLNVAADHQGRGYGRIAVQAVADEARARDAKRITVLWVTDDDGPERFYLRLGFRPTGQTFNGQRVGELLLD